MDKIKLTRGKYALVDKEDFKWLNQWEWQLCDQPTQNYALRKKRFSHTKVFTLRMHRVIMEKYGFDIKGKDIDHINHNGLDNRKCNLRVCSHSLNSANSRKSANNTSGYKGVNWDKQTNKWRSKITFNYKTISLGRFLTKEEAGLSYNQKAKELFKEFAYCNQI